MSSPYITRNEAAELSGASASVINKAVEQRVVTTRTLKTGRVLDARDAGALALFEMLADAGIPLPVAQKRRLRSWLRNAAQEDELAVGPGIVVRRLDAVEDVIERAERYVDLRDQFLEVNPKVRGGEPVIRGTRVPIRGLAKQVEAGESLDVLRDDYPDIPDEAFDFAVVWARANPRRGRPMSQAPGAPGRPGPQRRRAVLRSRANRAAAAAEPA